MSASISFPALTSETVLWQNRSAAEAFFNALVVESADPTNEGVVKQATTVSYTFTSLSNANYAIINVDDGASTVEVPKKDSYDELKASHIALATAFQSLLVNLKSAGIVQA